MFHAYAALKAGAPLTPYEYDPGPLGHHQVEIEIDYCGICHSDLSMIDNEWGMSSYPLVPGHEVVGRVVKFGKDVSGFAVGQVVGLGWHSSYCQHCYQCESGDHNLCKTAEQTIVGRHGGFADRVRADAKAVIPLPEGMDAKTAGPLFCGGITVFNPLLQCDVKPTDKVAVIGIGGLGHLGLQFLRAWGCEVTAFTSSQAKALEAKRLGAHHTISSTDQRQIEQAAGRFDFILSTVNVKLDWNLYMSTLKPRGRLHFVGATLAPLDLSVFSLILFQNTVSGSPVGSPATMKKMLEFALRHDIRPQVEIFPFEKVNDALEHLRQGNARYRVVLERG